MNSESISYYFRKMQEAKLPEGMLDPYGIFEEAEPKRRVLAENPFKLGDDDVFQLLGLIDGKIVGTVLLMPTMLQLDGKPRYSLIGHGLSVQEECRGKGIGSQLTDKRLDFSKTKSLLICAASAMQLPILKRLGASVFCLPRMILLRRSFSVLENKIGAVGAKIIAPLADLVFGLQQHWLKHISDKILSRGLTLKELDEAPYQVENIIAADGGRFQEHHTVEWFNWIMNNNLVNDPSLKKHFYMVYDSNKTPVGFFMTRERFYKQASHRGYKNVTMGAVLEWGTVDKSVVTDNELCLMALTSFSSEVDAVELCCSSEEMAAWFKRKGLVRVGDGNVVIRYRPESELAAIDGIGDARNWRLRPAMGDNGLS